MSYLEVSPQQDVFYGAKKLDGENYYRLCLGKAGLVLGSLSVRVFHTDELIIPHFPGAVFTKEFTPMGFL